MSRSRLIVVGLAFSLAGCVSTVAPTAEPTASPTLGITTMAPTTEPTASPTAAPTEPLATSEPTPAASPPSSPQASPGASIQQIFSDDFSDPNSGWGVGSNVAGTVSYSGGTLNFDIPQADAWLWSRRIVDESWPLLAVEGVAVPSSDGLFGAMCGTTDDVFVGGVMSTNGAWVFFRIESNTVTVLSSDSTAGLSVPVGLSSSFGIGCSGTDIGSFQMQLALGGTTVASYEGDDGLANFDRVGIYAEASSPDYAVSIDNVVAYAGRQAEGSGLSPAAQALLAHVPTDWQANCQETATSAFDAGALAAVACGLDEPGANIAEYVQFDGAASMNAAYQRRIDNYGVDSQGSCQTGPNEAGYTIDGISAGRLLCAPQLSGIRFDWTDERLDILTSLTDFEGSYPDTYSDWQAAGPN